MKFEKIKYVERVTGEIKVEDVPGESFLKFLYYNPLGKLPLDLVAKKKFLSSLYGRYMDTRLSASKIKSFIRDFNIDMEESVKSVKEFQTFNDFFIRKLKGESRKIVEENNKVASPADGKILAFEDIEDKDKFFIKGDEFTLRDFFKDSSLAKKYEGGTFIIIRLAPVDYHRYHFPLDGIVIWNKKVEGSYLSVSPYAVRNNFRIYCENKREISILRTKGFGDVVLSEIGATMVGGIVQTFRRDQPLKKGQEKGYFNFGGSSCILIFEKGKINIDQDILKNSMEGLETKVYMGEGIASLKTY